MAKTQFFENKTSVQSPKKGQGDKHFFVDMVSKLGFEQTKLMRGTESF